MDYSLSQINEIIKGELVGNGSARITGVASIDKAGQGDITFIKNESLIEKAHISNASAIVIHRKVEGLKTPLIVTKEPFLSFVKFLNEVSAASKKRSRTVHPSAVISSNSKLGRNLSIGPNVVIEDNVTIGDDVTIYPNTFIGPDCSIGNSTFIYANVTIIEQTTIGSSVTIHSGTVIGTDGFGYLQKDGKHIKIPQVGGIEIGDDVEIGANVTIDRAALDKTIIGNGVKIDNHSHIAHNVEIGDNTMLIAYAKIAGGTKIGKNVMIAEDVGITDNATIGDNCMIGGGSKVYKSLPPGSIVWGSPAKPLKEEKKIQAIIKKLPEMRQKLKQIKD
ncbi:MAG: UDP-3-O-(3-hydroxymyristoyl)glucosamine N-acyltransferase [Candidatus Anammoxibacter sp.]